jgi:hypothetical protein
MQARKRECPVSTIGPLWGAYRNGSSAAAALLGPEIPEPRQRAFDCFVRLQRGAYRRGGLALGVVLEPFVGVVFVWIACCVGSIDCSRNRFRLERAFWGADLGKIREAIRVLDGAFVDPSAATDQP